MKLRDVLACAALSVPLASTAAAAPPSKAPSKAAASGKIKASAKSRYFAKLKGMTKAELTAFREKLKAKRAAWLAKNKGTATKAKAAAERLKKLLKKK